MARQFLPPAKFSIIKQTYADSNRWIFKNSSSPWHQTHPEERGEHKPGFLLLWCLLPTGPFTCSRILYFWQPRRMPATATTLDATLATKAIATSASASPLNLGSCLLFPAQASGCLLLGSARPLGSTVRLRGPAQGRKTGLRTSVLPWRTGSRKRRYGTILCHLPKPRISYFSFCPPPESPQFSLSATSHPPIRPFSSCLPRHCPYAASVPVPQTDENQGLALAQRSCRHPALSDFLFMPHLPAWQGWEKWRWGPLGGSVHLAACWLAHWARVKKVGPCCFQTGDRSLSALPPPTGAIHPDFVPGYRDQWPHPCPSPYLHPQAPERWRYLQFEGWEARQAPPKRLSLTPGMGT